MESARPAGRPFKTTPSIGIQGAWEIKPSARGKQIGKRSYPADLGIGAKNVKIRIPQAILFLGEFYLRAKSPGVNRF